MERKYSQDDIVFRKKLGERLRFLREKHGFSQQQLAVEAEMSKNQIGRIERAEINPKITTLYIISKSLGIDINEFFVS